MGGDVLRRIILFVLVTIALLWMPATGYSTTWTHDKLQYVTLPRGYDRCTWEGAADFAHYRDTLIPRLWYARTATNYTINASLGLLIGGVFWGEAAASTINAGIVISYLGNAFTDITGGKIDKVLGYGGTPSALQEQANRLSNELGISDHYIFGGVSCDSGHDVIPLGAAVTLRIVPEQNRKTVIKLMRPEIELTRLDARVLEISFDGRYQYTTIKKVFGYEVVNGRQIRGPENRLWPLPVVPDAPERGGRVTGKIMLSYLPDTGHGGIREITISSPVNQGLVFPSRADSVPALVLNRDTVIVHVPNSLLFEAGKDLNFKVHIKGFHPGVGIDPHLPYYGFANWQKLADAVFEGITCRGAGVTRTSFQQSPDNLYTAVWCNPSMAGNVKLVMKALDGELIIADVMVPPARVPPQPDTGHRPDPPAPPGKLARFDNPKWNGERLDACLYWADKCGQPVADEFCRKNGYSSAGKDAWHITPRVKRTIVIMTGQICETGKNNPNCGAFDFIECK